MLGKLFRFSRSRWRKIYILRIFEILQSVCKQMSGVPDVNTRWQGRVVPLQPKSNRRFWPGILLRTRQSWKDHPHCSWEYLWDVSKQRSQRNFKVWRWRLVHQWKTHQEAKKPLYAPVIECGEGTLCTVDNLGDHHLWITYESLTESSFSEVFLTMVLFSREQRWDTSLLSQLLTRETPLQEYDPPENGFPFVGINKGAKCFLDKTHNDSATPSSDEPPDFRSEYPQPGENSKHPILHNTSEIWCYDGHQLVIGAVVSCHMTPPWCTFCMVSEWS